MMLRKGMKSLQISLNEFFEELKGESVTASAYSQARQQISHTAFIDLNNQAVIEPFYEDEDYKKYGKHRVLAIDGSVIMLPETCDVRASYGTIRIKNKTGDLGVYTSGRCSVAYDVLNGVALSSVLGLSDVSELSLVECFMADDLVVMDRGYCGYSTFFS
jgi:hypothetical protein